MKAPSKDMMNTLARSVLTLYSYDPDADNTSVENILRQCMHLIALFPLLAVYGYHKNRVIHAIRKMTATIAAYPTDIFFTLL